MKTKATKELARRIEARDNLLAFTKYTMPDFKAAKHHKLICEKLEAVARGDIKRLMICTPPRSGKSLLVSQKFPAWFLGRSPWKQVITASYGADLAYGFGRDVRNTFDTKEFRNLFPNVSIAKDCAAKNYWKTTSNGIYVAIGVGGGLTGRGGHICVVAGTKVEDVDGPKNIEDIKPGDMVLSHDEENNLAIFSKVHAVSRSDSNERYRLHTTGGSVVEATPEHLFYANGSWLPIASLVAGDKLLRCVQNRVQSFTRRHDKSRQSGQNKFALFTMLHREISKYPTRTCTAAPMPKLRENIGSREEQTCLQFRVPGSEAVTFEREFYDSRAALQTMQPTVSTSKQQAAGSVLLPSMQGSRTFSGNVAREQSMLEGWERPGEIGRTLGSCISICEAFGQRKRREFLRGLRSNGEVAGSPHRHGRNKQLSQQPSDPVQKVSRELSCGRAFDTEEDTVSLVERVCGARKVYDIEVEGTHNFFAESIKISNCIIDDPVKDRQDAESAVVQERTWDWYRSVLRTRLMPNASVVLCQTRWHPMDLAGRLIDAMHSGGEQWEIINLPAIANSPDDPLGRELGEPLWPEWYPLEALRATEASVGPREWSALYQQEPTTGSEFFSASQFLVADRPVAIPQAVKFVYATVDTTQKGGKGRDGTAVSYWALQELKIPGQYPLTLLDWDIVEHEGGLLDIWFPQVFQRLEELAKATRARNGTIGAFVEDKAAGSILLQQAPRFGWPMHPIDSKLTSVGKDARMINASSYINQGLVKIALPAFDKQIAFHGATRNHWLTQITNFRIGQDGAGREDDLSDTMSYGCALGLGNYDGF